jgi:hypothetical protein
VIALLVYESMFGNTKRIAEAIAEGIGSKLPVKAVEVGTAPDVIDPEVELLVVGGPTHIHGMSSARSRAGAVERIDHLPISRGIGMREWLERTRPVSAAQPAAAFDTRINGPEVLTGSAASGYVKRLRSAGFRVAVKPRSFRVRGRAEADEDALVPGELEQARAWGRELALAVRPD